MLGTYLLGFTFSCKYSTVSTVSNEENAVFGPTLKVIYFSSSPGVNVFAFWLFYPCHRALWFPESELFNIVRGERAAKRPATYCVRDIREAESLGLRFRREEFKNSKGEGTGTGP